VWDSNVVYALQGIPTPFPTAGRVAVRENARIYRMKSNVWPAAAAPEFDTFWNRRRRAARGLTPVLAPVAEATERVHTRTGFWKLMLRTWKFANETMQYTSLPVTAAAVTRSDGLECRQNQRRIQFRAMHNMNCTLELEKYLKGHGEIASRLSLQARPPILKENDHLFLDSGFTFAQIPSCLIAAMKWGPAR